MLPAVRLDCIDVFTTLKIQWTTTRTKASLYQGLGLNHWELAHNFRWHLVLMGPWARPPSFLLQALTGGKIPTGFKEAVTIYSLLRTAQGGPAQGTRAEISQKLSKSRGKNTSEDKHIYLDTCGARSDEMEIRWEDRWQIKNRNKQPDFKVHGFSKIAPLPQQWESLNQHTQWASYPPFLFLFFSPIPMK